MRSELDAIEDRVLAAVRRLLSEAGVTQAELGDLLGKSQAAVSHMLARRGHGLTVREVAAVEGICRAAPGSIFRSADAFGAGQRIEPDLGLAVHEIAGIHPQAAAALSSAIYAVRSEIRREETRP
jgi:transcriptional regulator with XRE-family HTH domain